MPGFEARIDELFAVGYRVGFRLTGSRLEAEDIAQEAVARSLVRWPKIEPYAAAWVARVATNLALDQLRRSRRAPPVADESQDQVMGDRLDLVRALERLPRRQRDVIVLRYLADLDENVVAAQLHCSAGTVKQHAHRGLARLRADTRLTISEDC
jgi:RNA polymerase sigma factor (sigma-70 family)